MVKITISDLNVFHEKTVLDEPSYEEMNNIGGGYINDPNHQTEIQASINEYLHNLSQQLNDQIRKLQNNFRR